VRVCQGMRVLHRIKSENILRQGMRVLHHVTSESIASCQGMRVLHHVMLGIKVLHHVKSEMHHVNSLSSVFCQDFLVHILHHAMREKTPPFQ
jgi:hypothetical protein